MVLFKKKSRICICIAVTAIILCGTFIICHVARVKSTKNVTECNAPSDSDVRQASADVAENGGDSYTRNDLGKTSQNNDSLADNASKNASQPSSSGNKKTVENPTTKVQAKPASTEQPKKASQSDSSKCKTAPPKCKTVPSKSPQKHVSAKFGISIDFPASWQGKYKIVERDEQLAVIFKPASHPVESGGLLFVITKRTEDLQNCMYDTVGKRYVTNAKGDVFLIGGPTDVGFPTENPEYATYRQMTKELSSVVNTIKSIH